MNKVKCSDLKVGKTLYLFSYDFRESDIPFSYRELLIKNVRHIRDVTFIDYETDLYGAATISLVDTPFGVVRTEDKDKSLSDGFVVKVMTDTEEARHLVKQVQYRERVKSFLYAVSESYYVRLQLEQALAKADDAQAEKVFAAMDTILNLVRDE